MCGANFNVVQAMGILLQGATYVVAKRKIRYILHIKYIREGERIFPCQRMEEMQWVGRR